MRRLEASALRVRRARLYFNHYSKKLSEIIRKPARRIPSLNIFYASENIATSIERKYRYLNKRKLTFK